MRTAIHTTESNRVLGNGRGRFVTAGANDLRSYCFLRLRLDEGHCMRAIASPRAEKLRPSATFARPVQWLQLCCSSLFAIGPKCLRPWQPCGARLTGSSG